MQRTATGSGSGQWYADAAQYRAHTSANVSLQISCSLCSHYIQNEIESSTKYWGCTQNKKLDHELRGVRFAWGPQREPGAASPGNVRSSLKVLDRTTNNVRVRV